MSKNKAVFESNSHARYIVTVHAWRYGEVVLSLGPTVAPHTNSGPHNVIRLF
jgi:hypothetical protein